jgi:hypothetical protein
MTKDAFDRSTPAERLRYLALLGHLAPNSHNTQPWRFRLDADSETLDVYLDRRFVLPASDVKGRQAVVSVGCAVEHIVIGAASFGCETKVGIVDEEPSFVRPMSASTSAQARYVRLATLQFVPTESETEVSERLVRAMFTRKVVRAEYDPSVKLPPSLANALTELTVADLTRVRLLVDARLRTSALAEIQAQADAYVINTPSFSRELGDWLLPNDTTSFVGMPGVGFGLSDSEALRIHRGLREEQALYPEDGLKFALAGKKGIETSSAIAFITSERDDVSGWLAAGRTLARALLQIESEGFHTAIHAGIVEVTPLNRLFAAALRTTRPLTALFRIGKARNPEHAERPHSPRLALDDVLLTSTDDV